MREYMSPELMGFHTSVMESAKFFGYHDDLMGNRSKYLQRLLSDYVKSVKVIKVPRSAVRRNTSVMGEYLEVYQNLLRGGACAGKTEAHEIVMSWAMAVASTELKSNIEGVSSISQMLFGYVFTAEERERLIERMRERDELHGIKRLDEKLIDAFKMRPAMLGWGGWQEVARFAVEVLGVEEKQARLQIGKIILAANKSSDPLNQVRRDWAFDFLSREAGHFVSFKQFKDYCKAEWASLPANENDLLKHFNLARKALSEAKTPEVLAPLPTEVLPSPEVLPPLPTEEIEVLPLPEGLISEVLISEGGGFVKCGGLTISVRGGGRVVLGEMEGRGLEVSGGLKVSIAEISGDRMKGISIS